MFEVHRYHDISCGHRVVGHENKCRWLHGHNYRIHFTCAAMGDVLDKQGRVIDFGVIKVLLCEWLEHMWDHKMLIWTEDHLYQDLRSMYSDSIFGVPFNPTAENMAKYLVEVVGPQQLSQTNVVLTSVTVDETRKCSATYTLQAP